MEEIKATLAGLYTAISSTAAAPGSLLEAENVVCARPGSVEQRPGFADTTQSAATTRLLPLPDAHLLHLKGDGTLLQDDTGAERTDDDGVDLDYAAPVDLQGAPHPYGCYITHADGVRDVVVGQAAAYLVGAPTPGVSVLTAASGTGPAGSSYYAYRAVTLRKDSTGKREIRSGVSNRDVILTGATANYDTAVRVLLHKGTTRWRSGDAVELYRTLASTTSTPAEYLYRVGTYPVTSTNITNGYVDITDTIPDAGLRDPLYTNDDEEGLTATHRQTPRAKALTIHNQSVWLGGLTFQPEEVLEVTQKYGATSTEVGYHLLGTVGFTNGSGTATTASAAAWMVGRIMFVGGTATTWTAYPVVTAVTPGVSITLSANWPGTTGNKTDCALLDTITIDGTTHPVYPPTCLEQSIRTGTFSVTQAPLPAAVLGSYSSSGSGHSTSCCAEVLTDGSAGSNRPWAARVYALDIDDTVTVTGTSGAAYTRDISSAYTLVAEQVPDGIMWSNASEPEHFNLINVDRAGLEDSEVCALTPCGGSLMVFTSRGLTRASGSASTGVRLDVVDRGVILLTPDAAVGLNGNVYALCTQGVVELRENGAEAITRNRISELDDLLSAVQGTTRLVPGVWATNNPGTNLVMFGLPTVLGDAADEDAATSVLVYSTLTRAWTVWFPDSYLYHGTYLPEYGNWFVGDLGDSPYLRGEKTPTMLVALSADDIDTNAESDNVYDITLTGYDSAVPLAYTWTGSRTPEVGDCIAGRYYGDGPVVHTDTVLVTSVAGDTLTVDTSLGDVSDYTLTLSEAIPCRVTPIAMEAKNPGSLKLWGEGSLWWGSRYGLQRVTLSFRSPHVLATTTNSYTKTLSDSRITNDSITKAGALRFIVPKNNARSTHLYPTVGIRQAGSKWRLDAVTAKFRYAGGRPQGKFA